MSIASGYSPYHFEHCTLMFRKLIALSCVLAGCAATNEIVPVGKDTYMVSGWGKSPGGYSGAEVKATAIHEASKFCADQGKQVQVVTANQRDMSFGVNATAELQFMCLSSSDTDFTRATVKKEADQVLEVRKDIRIKDDTPPKSVHEELLKLDDLRKRGIVSETEFAAQKAKLLAK
jgi:hypothetical protein